MDKYFYFNLRNVGLKWSDEQFRTVIEDTSEALDDLAFLANTMFERKIKDEDYKYYSETLAYKFIYQSLNLRSILKGVQFNSKIFSFDRLIFDVSSAYIIQRALFENYLTFFYLYIQPKTEDEKLCKWLIYKISGLKSRQDFKSDFVEYKEKIESERQEIQESINQLKSNCFFQTLLISKQNQILNNFPARLTGWQKLFNSSELRSEMFVKAWRLYSNYAHSEYISLIQFKDFRQDTGPLLTMKNLVSFISLVLTSVFIKDMVKLYSEILENFNSLPNSSIECINFLDGIGRKPN